MACKGIVHKNNNTRLILQTNTTMATTTITRTRMTALPGWYYRPPRRGRRPRRVGRSLCPPSSPPWRSWSRWCCCSGRSWWWWWWCLIGFSKFLFSAETCRGRWQRSPWPRTQSPTKRCAWTLRCQIQHIHIIIYNNNTKYNMFEPWVVKYNISEPWDIKYNLCEAWDIKYNMCEAWDIKYNRCEA